MAASEAVTSRTVRGPPISPAVPTDAAPKAPNITLTIDRFIAFVMMRVRIIPAAPTSAPATIRMGLPSTNPALAAARPE